MAQYNNNKSSNDVDWGEAILIVFIFSLPIIATIVPFLTSIKDSSTPKEMLEIWREVIQPAVMILNAFLAAFIIFLILEILPLQRLIAVSKEKGDGGEQEIKKDPEIAKRWGIILERANTPTPDNLRLAVMEGDALVDTFLKRNGYAGDTMADRLSTISSVEIKSLNSLWDAHRLRNILAHTPGAKVSETEARVALGAFERFLKELGAI